MLRRSRRVLFFSLNNKNNNVYYCTRTGSSIVSTKFLSFVFWNFEPRIIIKSFVFGLHEIRAYEYRSLILLDLHKHRRVMIQSDWVHFFFSQPIHYHYIL